MILPVNEVLLKILRGNGVYFWISLFFDKELVGVIPNSTD